MGGPHGFPYLIEGYKTKWKTKLERECKNKGENEGSDAELNTR